MDLQYGVLYASMRHGVCKLCVDPHPVPFFFCFFFLGGGGGGGGMKGFTPTEEGGPLKLY